MRTFLLVAVLSVEVLVSGCATSIGAYEQGATAEGDAIVLVGVDSEIPLAEARYCKVVCMAWYRLDGRKDIMAFPTRVGSTFMLNAVHTTDNRAAPLKGTELKIERRGVYYYGTIFGTFARAGIRTTPHPRQLLAAKRKYGARFDGLEAVNFTWPDPSYDRYLGIGYKVSPDVQDRLRPFAGRRLQLAKVAPPANFDPGCRMGRPISLPDYLPYEEYVRRAFNNELEGAQLYDEKPGALVLSGAITDLSFSTTGESKWDMGLRVESPNGRAVLARVSVPFTGAFAAPTACVNAENAVPNVVQKLIEAVVRSPDFAALVSD